MNHLSRRHLIYIKCLAYHNIIHVDTLGRLKYCFDKYFSILLMIIFVPFKQNVILDSQMVVIAEVAGPLIPVQAFISSSGIQGIVAFPTVKLQISCLYFFFSFSRYFSS